MKLRIVDDLTPEDTAMLQALYSRSAESVDVHLEKVKQSGSGKFMSNFYVGYGHKSIADCGSTTMFIEGVSLLAAKAVQDWPLYSGQETSTRYIDMSKQSIVDPYGTSDSKAILDRWMRFYTDKHDAVGEIIRARYPRRDEEKPETYDRAVKARTFDVLRGFLPAGITTQLSWHSNLRQASDHLERLLAHPSPEITQIAFKLRESLHERYAASGFDRSLASVSGVNNNKDRDARDARQDWEWRVAQQFTYSVDRRYHHFHDKDGGVKMYPAWNRPGMPLSEIMQDGTRYSEILKTRPKGCVLPHFMSDLCSFTFDFLLDFGSFRDIQRHRNGVCRMPLLDTSWGFEPWYLEQLGDLRNEAETLIDEQRFEITKLGLGEPNREVLRQYYNALGFRVPCSVTYALPALLYVLELRTGKTVHPSLRKVIHAMIKKFQREYSDVALHVDMDPDDWDVRRGDQTITEKK
jgi:thymidylate synthase ThyX